MSDDLGRQAVLERATYTYCNVLIVLSWAIWGNRMRWGVRGRSHCPAQGHENSSRGLPHVIFSQVVRRSSAGIQACIQRDYSLATHYHNAGIVGAFRLYEFSLPTKRTHLFYPG